MSEEWTPTSEIEEKLSDIFKARLARFLREKLPGIPLSGAHEAWHDYLKKQGIDSGYFHWHDYLKKQGIDSGDFYPSDLGPPSGFIHDPLAPTTRWIAINEEIAMKILVLGELP